MAETSSQVEIPNRALFKASEVCDLAKVQPYVLRSWEAEFKDLGVVKNGSTTRVYRREDVERVLRIKHLLLIEGLTLAGVRRRLDEENEPPLEADLADVSPASAPLTAEARERISSVKRGLRSLLDLLAAPAQGQEAAPAQASGASGAAATVAADFSLTPAEQRELQPKPPRRSAAKDDGRSTANEEGPPKAASPRRKRSA